MAGFVQPEAPSLRYPDQLPLHATLTLEQAFKFLSSAPQMSMNRPYSWGYIDRPPEGQLLLLFLPNSKAFPNDGIRWQEEEVMHPVSAGGNREMEVYEVKAGFAPGIDELAWRARRRFRLSKGGHPQLQLVHYSRGQNRPIIPSLMSQPVRAYPLPHITQPPVVVLGDKKPFPPGMPGNMSNIPLGTMSVAQQQALVASQVGTMDRREREQRARESSGNPAAAANAHMAMGADVDSDDDTDFVSTRSLAMLRYRRNHELMNEVLVYASQGHRPEEKPKRVYTLFNKEELEAKAEKLKIEVEALTSKAKQRREHDSDSTLVALAGA